jgi:hypothetical protein
LIVTSQKVLTCGRSSAGRASPCQGEGRGFEPRRPLQCNLLHRFVPLAQLDRAFDYESKGREFESLRARHSKRWEVGTARVSPPRREVAQLGRALGSGPRGRRFKSCLPDHSYSHQQRAAQSSIRSAALADNACGCSSVVEPQPSKLVAWVRFPSPAPNVSGGVAQLARAFGSYPKGRGFKPLHRYHMYMAIVAKWLTHRIVAPAFVGSIPIDRPIFLFTKGRPQPRHMRSWWNWQTHHLEGVAGRPVRVRVSPNAPSMFTQPGECSKPLQAPGFLILNRFCTRPLFHGRTPFSFTFAIL